MSRNHLKRLWIVAFSLCYLCSCEKNEVTEHNTPNVHQENQENEETLNFKALYSSHHTIDINEAAKLAIEATKLLTENNELRSSRHREISDVSVMLKENNELRNGSPTPPSLPDTLAYVFNFADSAGYAIICADDRVNCPILACVENGTLDIEKESDNPGINIFLENAQIFMEQSIIKFEQEKDSLLTEAEKTQKENKSEILRKTYTGGYYIVLDDYYKGPLLKTAWGQESPYYNECPPCDDRNSKVGCWAVAIGQVFTYHKYPQTITGIAYNYTIMNKLRHINKDTPSEKQKPVAQLLHSIGVSIDMNYGCSSSSADVNNVVPWLRNIGYTVETMDYKWNTVKRQLDLGHPVIMHGKRSKRKFFGITIGYKNGHAWVLDGYKCTKTQYETYKVDLDKDIYEITSSTTKSIDYYLHINWGWDGENNGYFAEGCFNILDYESLDEDYSQDNEYDYKYEQEILLLAD